MKCVIQRVLRAVCSVNGEVTGRIEKGLLVYVGFAPEDTTEKVDWMVDRVRRMRIFEDENGKMNLSVGDVEGKVLWIPNFTLYADPMSRRPSFSGAMPADEARHLFGYLLQADIATVGAVEAGLFGADMKIENVADGPINVVVER